MLTQLQVFLVGHQRNVANLILFKGKQDFFRIKFIISINVNYLCAAPLTYNVVSVNVIMLKLIENI